MRNDSEKKSIWYVSAGLTILLLLCGTQMAACTISVGTPLLSSITAPATAATSRTTQAHQIAQAVFNAINKNRVTAGLSPLQWSDALARSAYQHNLAMTAANQLAHQLPGEAGLGDREKRQGITWFLAAENIGFTEDMSERGVLGLHQAMMAERPPDDGHRQNILSTQSNQLGVDVLFDARHGRYWLTEDFARV
ncbi:MAG TPA: CAP domain-containing protein, partial [Ktedonobacteraceae bacterium]